LSDKRVFLILLSQSKILSISIQIKARGSNQTSVKAENLHQIQSGTSKTSYHFFRHFFLKLEFSPATIVKCCVKESPSFFINLLKKLNIDTVSIVHHDLLITIKSVSFNFIISSK